MQIEDHRGGTKYRQAAGFSIQLRVNTINQAREWGIEPEQRIKKKSYLRLYEPILS